jgi:hypothetical protein
VVLVGVMAKVPLVAFAPVQPPEAAHEVAFALDQVNVELLPDVTDVGFAVKVTLGAAVAPTATIAEALADPPVPVQESE